jgi:hypothetical protein
MSALRRIHACTPADVSGVMAASSLSGSDHQALSGSAAVGDRERLLTRSTLA